MRTKKKDLRKQANDLADRLAPHVETAREKAAPLLADAREKAAPVLAEAREKAAPVIAEAREKAAPAVTGAKERIATEVVPMLTAALAAATEATEEVRDETKKRGKATVAALKGEVEAPEKSKHRVRKFVLVLGVGGVIAAVAKKLSDRQASTAWQSAYTPPSPAPTTPTAAPTPPAGAHKADTADDEGGASPDVAVADSAAAPHSPTTPDNPAEEVDLTKE
jgi:vacuolar-type H+-ATPase subunit H